MPSSFQLQMFNDLSDSGMKLDLIDLSLRILRNYSPFPFDPVNGPFKICLGSEVVFSVLTDNPLEAQATFHWDVGCGQIGLFSH